MIGRSAGKSFAYILGVYLGDGCVTRPSTRSADGVLCFKLNTIDLDFAQATKAALADLTDRPVSISKHAVSKSSNPNHSLYCGDTGLCRQLVELTDNKQRLPQLDTRDERIALIVGLMDSEGFVAANKSNPTNRRYYMGFKSCDPWVPDFIRLLEGVGVKIGVIGKEEPRKPGYKPPTRFTIKMRSWIDAGCYFNIQRKQRRVEEWAAAGAYERRARHPRRLTSETTRQTPETGMI